MMEEHDQNCVEKLEWPSRIWEEQGQVKGAEEYELNNVKMYRWIVFKVLEESEKKEDS